MAKFFKYSGIAFMIFGAYMGINQEGISWVATGAGVIYLGKIIERTESRFRKE